MTALEFNHQIASEYSTLQLFTRKFTKNEEDSRDLIQETIMKALANRSKFKSHTNLKGWLYTIMRNTFINGYRKAKNHNTHNDTTENDYYLNREDYYTSSNPLQNYEYNEMQKLVDSLPDKLKIPFQQYCSGFKYEELADKNDVPLGTIKNRIFQARKMLREMMAA